jgi:hypothetical protein
VWKCVLSLQELGRTLLQEWIVFWIKFVAFSWSLQENTGMNLRITIIASFFNLANSSILIKSFDTLWSQIWQLYETNSLYTALYYTHLKSYMFRLHEAIILGLHVLEICKKKKSCSCSCTFNYRNWGPNFGPYMKYLEMFVNVTFGKHFNNT